MGDEQHRFYFAPGVRVVQRDENCLQFGVDSTRVGIIETTRPKTLATSLHELPRLFNRKDFSIASHSAGLTQPAAHSLFDDLLAYGIIRPALSRPVIVLGTGFLATMLRNALTDADFLVRSPLPGEPEETYLSMQNAQDNNIPVLVVDRLAETTTMAPLLLAMARTWIPVSLIDATGVVGPIHINAMGPCPLCMELHRTDRDPTWHAATQGLRSHQTSPGSTASPGSKANKGKKIADGSMQHFPTAAAHSTVAHVIVTLESFYELSPPPGASPHRIHPGQLYELDPYARPQQRIVDNHPRCPECFMHTDGRYRANPAQTVQPFSGLFR
ncbi:hypothetical protein QPX10_09695 [Corynebacterium pseudodiphtheriticum]|uniref:hypothetical protein n=1 Tax=Corynebacterium pseudodiphtheriticum TaxID=37637 RepID=UPI00253FC77A|nr:hypothetical protein [Corynebacterium pseudodiphtheriticum]MDK4243942.1 hypothetical protein [Corynebacterium pseudodiphtheriticum]MDK4274297.1 hypothetical protein [Corynebacterium pseudodiphtheriticum]